MDRAGRLRERLPSVYRPDPADEGLLPALLAATGAELDSVDVDALAVLRAHRFEQADAAVLDAYEVRLRALAGLPAMGPSDPAARTFPYVRDLALLSAVLGATPWQDAPPVETVEDFRDRVRRTVAVYRGGLGTRAAIQGIVEANLPVDDSLPAERRDRPFEVEEFAPIVHESLAVRSPGPPEDLVGPLMRWEVGSDGLTGSPPTIYVQGVEPVAGSVGTAKAPLVELFEAGAPAGPVRLGIAYVRTLDPGVTLRLRPAFSSWLARDDGLLRAEALPPDTGAADPTASGPWTAVAGAPNGAVTVLAQSVDLWLWAGTLDAGVGTLSRFDGTAWSTALTGLEAIRALAEDADDLLVGTDAGLLRMPRFPDGDAFTGTPLPGLEAAPVTALLPDGDGWLVGTTGGLFRMAGDGGVGPFGLDASSQTATAVRALARDATGTVHVGTDLGAFQFQPATGRWYWFGGGSLSEQDPDWHELTPGADGDTAAMPTDADVTLPAVRCVRRGPDAALWFGTDHGIARYVALDAGGGSQTILQAFPNMTGGPVSAIDVDARGRVWFATDRGLIRTDGRDWFQFQPAAGAWVHLGRVDRAFEPRATGWGAWSFDRASASWSHADAAGRTWTPVTMAPETTEEPGVHAVLWTDGAVADLLQGWDGSTFASAAPADAADVRVRYKPTDRRIVDGGIPASPRIPPGPSTWRYLSMEVTKPKVPKDRPFWTTEGRLLPPPGDRDASVPGRFDEQAPDAADFGDSVFAYDPAARVWMTWEASRPLTVLVRIAKRSSDEHLEPAVVDRAWQGIQQVRPAGVLTVLAVDEDIVRR